MVAAMMVRRALPLSLGLLVAATACQWHASAGTTPTVPPQPNAPATTPATAPATATDAADPLAAWSLTARPTWMDRYADDTVGDLRFFNISALMREHGLTRDRAVELQNHYRDASRADPGGDPTAHFEAALAKAKRGEFEGRRDVARLAEAAFIVVFDLDDTLYDQSYDAAIAATCADLRFEFGGKPKTIKLAPGAAAALDRVAALGGAVVIFTAAPDESSLANLRAWQFGGKPLPDHPAIAGVLTNSHLVLQDKREGDGAADPKRGHPVIEPSKDLRIVDEGLTRAILVDDNPLRTFQPRNLRLTKKFDAASYCATKDAKLKRAFERTLPDVVAEIEESLRWAKQAKAPFAIAYLPHSQIGRLAVGFLRGAGMSEKAAIEYVRTHPEVVDRDF
jgi:hypothetical protein